MNKRCIESLGLGFALALSATAFADQTCNGALFNGHCFEKLKPVDCYLEPFVFDDDENVIGGGGLICTGEVNGNAAPIVVHKQDLKFVRSAGGNVTTYISTKKVAKFKAGAARATATKKSKKDKS